MQYIWTILLGAGFGILNRFLYREEMSFEWKKPEIPGPVEKIDGIILVVSLLLAFYSKAMYGGVTFASLEFLLLANLLFVVAVIDWKEQIVPDQILVVYLVLILVHRLCDFSMYLLINRGLGAVGGAAVLGFLHFVRKDEIGLGDVKLAAVCGLVTGLTGVFALLFRGTLCAAVYGIYLLVRKKAGMKSEVPFVPFLFLGSLL